MLKKKINIINFSKNKTSNKILNNEKVSLYIGPWCKNKINLLTENFDDTLNFYKPTNIKEYNQDIRLLKKNYLILLKLITNILNISHNKKYKIRFWEILIGRWLNTWINSVYFRWDYINKIKLKTITLYVPLSFTKPVELTETIRRNFASGDFAKNSSSSSNLLTVE
jgi:putative transferase (TIGR04331 family)